MTSYLEDPSAQYFGIKIKILIKRIKTYSKTLLLFSSGTPRITKNDLNFAEGELRRHALNISRMDIPRNIKSDKMIESIIGACDKYKMPKIFFDSHIQLIVDRIRNTKLSTRSSRTHTTR